MSEPATIFYDGMWITAEDIRSLQYTRYPLVHRIDRYEVEVKDLKEKLRSQEDTIISRDAQIATLQRLLNSASSSSTSAENSRDNQSSNDGLERTDASARIVRLEEENSKLLARVLELEQEQSQVKKRKEGIITTKDSQICTHENMVPFPSSSTNNDQHDQFSQALGADLKRKRSQAIKKKPDEDLEASNGRQKIQRWNTLETQISRDQVADAAPEESSLETRIRHLEIEFAKLKKERKLQ